MKDNYQGKSCYYYKEPWNKDHIYHKIEEFKEKNLCFRCNEPWKHGPWCKRGQMNKITYDDETPNKKARVEEHEHATLAIITQEDGDNPFQITQ